MILLLGWLIVLRVIVFFLAVVLGRIEARFSKPAPQQTSAEHGTRRAPPVQGRNQQSPFYGIRVDPFERARVTPAL